MTGDVPEPRAWHCATVSVRDGDEDLEEVFVFGGKIKEGDDGQLSNDLWSYHPPTNVWKKLESSGSSPKPRMRSSITFWFDEGLRKEYLLVFGGVDEDGEALSDLWRYDLSENSWKIISISTEESVSDGEFPRARSRIQTSIMQNRYLTVVGGVSNSNRILSDVWLFDLALYADIERIVSVSQVSPVSSQQDSSESTDAEDQYINDVKSLLIQNPWIFSEYPQVSKKVSDYVSFVDSGDIFLFGGLDRDARLTYFTRVVELPFKEDSSSSSPNDSPNSSNSSSSSFLTPRLSVLSFLFVFFLSLRSLLTSL